MGDQPIEHTYILTNPRPHPVRLVDSSALVPCCSSISAPSDPVPPGSPIAVPVTLRPANQEGRKRVEFTIRFDDPLLGEVLLGLEVDLIPAREIIPDDANRDPVQIGKPHRWSYRVVTRRHGDEGQHAPTSALAEPPLSAQLIGSPREHIGRGGITETESNLEVSIGASSAIGFHRSFVRLVAPGQETEWSLPVAWRVDPVIQISPSGVILGSDAPAEHRFVIRSRDRPIRILDVRGEDFARSDTELPTRESEVHSLTILIDAARCPEDRAAEIVIRTDHPLQPELSVSLVAMRPVED